MNSNCSKCQWSNPMLGTSDGSAGYEKAMHDSLMHADHEHVYDGPVPEKYVDLVAGTAGRYEWSFCSTCGKSRDVFVG